jgi:hypothetical protein
VESKKPGFSLEAVGVMKSLVKKPGFSNSAIAALEPKAIAQIS